MATDRILDDEDTFDAMARQASRSCAGAAGSVSFPKSVRFAAEMETAMWLQAVAKERGHKMTLVEAHEAWAEHSDAYAASWLLVDSENQRAEAWRAITVWWHRHRKPNIADEGRA